MIRIIMSLVFGLLLGEASDAYVKNRAVILFNKNSKVSKLLGGMDLQVAKFLRHPFTQVIQLLNEDDDDRF